MSAAELNALEREVELTRAKFANDLARLRSPHNIAEFKEALWARARETKDGVLAEVKARAAANPAAVAALAAGVAWRLYHHPPSQRFSSAWGSPGCCERRRHKRTTPTPKISSIPKSGAHVPAGLRMPQNKRSRIGLHRRARLRARPRRRLRRQLYQWRSAHLRRCVMPVIPRGIA